MQQATRTKSRRDEYTEATRRALLQAGREAFARDGFQAAAIESISRAARVTRGAFYHHFADKTTLFDAVVVELQQEAAAAIKRRAKTRVQVWDRLTEGVEAFLDVCLDPTYARIVVCDSPVVLGNSRFREIEEAYPMALLTATLSALERQGELAFPDIPLLSRLLDAMICKLAIMLPSAPDPQQLRGDGQAAIAALLGALRPTRTRRGRS